MSRVAKAPIEIPAGVEVTLNGQEVTIKGAQGSLSRVVNDAVELVKDESELRTNAREGVANSTAQAVRLVHCCKTWWSESLKDSNVSYS